MKTGDQVGVTFVNSVLGRGVYNGVVNVQFGVAHFDGEEDGTVSTAVVPACRLRMDVVCARDLHAQLGELLDVIDKAAAGVPAGVADAAEARPNGKDH